MAGELKERIQKDKREKRSDIEDNIVLLKGSSDRLELINLIMSFTSEEMKIFILRARDRLISQRQEEHVAARH